MPFLTSQREDPLTSSMSLKASVEALYLEVRTCRNTSVPTSRGHRIAQPLRPPQVSKRREQPTNEWRKIETMQDAELISIEAKAFKDDRAVAAGRRSQSAAKKQKPGPEMPLMRKPRSLTCAQRSADKV